MATYLDAILDRKRLDLKAQHAAVPLAELKARAAWQPKALDFPKALSGPGVKVIAEVKKASPSRGVMAGTLDPGAIAKTYADGGAAAISVLTEEPHFRGKLEYLTDIKAALAFKGPPLLRKDFILEPYQVYEARAYCADTLLLIVAALPDELLLELLGLARELGMEPLVEVHDVEEAGRAVAAGARVIGINNRDLRTFKTTLATTGLVRPHIPLDRIVVSESGISTPDEVALLSAWGVNVILVGEALVTAPDVAAKLRELNGKGVGSRVEGGDEMGPPPSPPLQRGARE